MDQGSLMDGKEKGRINDLFSALHSDMTIVPQESAVGPHELC